MLENIINNLSPSLREEVYHYAEFLLLKQSKAASLEPKKLKLSWAGGLKEFKNEYASGLELQKKILEWR